MAYPRKLSREKVLQGGLELLCAEGMGRLSMRNLAAHLGVRPSSLYRHIKDRDALLDALEEEATVGLHRALEAATLNKSPEDAFDAAGLAYYNYATENAELYALLLRDEQVYSAAPGAGKDVWNCVLAIVGRVSGNPDDTAGAVAFWSLLHGFIALERGGRFGPSGAKGGLVRGLESLRRGLAP